MAKVKKLNGRAKEIKLPTKRTVTAHGESAGGSVRKQVGKRTSFLDVLKTGNLPATKVKGIIHDQRRT